MSEIGNVEWSELWELGLAHVYLAGLPLLIGLTLALPLGWVAARVPRLRTALVSGSALLYTIPSLALFILLPGIIGTQILDPLNVLIAMSLYTVALLVRNVADGLGAVPEHVRQAATAMGLGRWRRLTRVELPLAVPIIAAGLRVAAVSNVSIVSVAALVGIPQLGILFTRGFNRDDLGMIAVGMAGCVLLALLFDAVILLLRRLLTPWLREVRA